MTTITKCKWFHLFLIGNFSWISVKKVINILGKNLFIYRRTDTAPTPLHLLYGDLFIGGLPLNYNVVKGAVATDQPFVGCIGDATLNGTVINLANFTNKAGNILGKCILDKQIGSDTDIHTGWNILFIKNVI